MSKYNLLNIISCHFLHEHFIFIFIDVMFTVFVCPCCVFIVYLVLMYVLAGAIKFALSGINKVLSYLKHEVFVRVSEF